MKQDLLAAVENMGGKKSQNGGNFGFGSTIKKGRRNYLPHHHLHIEAEWYFVT